MTDVLTTLFVAKGVEQYANAYDKAIQKNKKLAEQNEKLVGKGKAPKALLDPFTEAKTDVIKNLTSYGTAALAVGASFRFMAESIQEFAKAEDVIFRSTVVLNNLGTSLKPAALKEMADHLSRIAGIDDEAIVQVGTTLAQFGLSGQVTAKTLRSIADASAATGKSLDDVAMAASRGSKGSTRALLQMGIQFKATGNQAKDFNTILAEFDKRFAGAAAARRDTPAGAIDAMTVAIGNFKEAFGQTFSGIVIPLLNTATSLIQLFTGNLDKVLPVLMGPLAELTKVFGYKPSYQNIGKGGAGLATEETQKEIAKNTAKMSDAFIRQVAGGPGTVARGAMTLRDARLAFGG